MSETTLHYIFDPLCGWCYGAASLVQAAQNIPGLTLVLHGGGMMSGANRRQIDAQWRDYVMPHDKRIAELTGQVFGDNYFNQLLKDTSAIMDSTPPITAILAADKLAGYGVKMLHSIQLAHYVEGRRIADTPVLAELAIEIGLNSTDFINAYRTEQQHVDQHIAQSRALLTQVQGHGFPTFILQNAQGNMKILFAGDYLGNQSAWFNMLTRAVAS